jgi:hypothetical protein
MGDPDYYVYVYIDPRNLEEFYYGKGRDRRKEAHLSDESDSEKVKRINAIREEGLSPIIRVIARGLTEDQAFLIEKTLLWKLGKALTNQATGNFSEKFRPHNKLHLELSGFDYCEGIYYFNVGDSLHRRWTDCKRLGFIGAGQGKVWRDAICAFREGDIFAAYLKNNGFVGIGRITQRARPIREVLIQGKPLINHSLDCANMCDNIDSDEMCEYVALVKWERAVEPHEAKWKAKAGIYTTPLVRASLENQPETLSFLEREFDIDLRSTRNRRAELGA